MPRTKKVVQENNTKDTTFAERLQSELQLKQSYLNLFLGFLIVLVVGVLIFNYFKQSPGNLGPAEQTVSEQNTQAGTTADATPQNLPGKYTVKDGDSLFSIAEHYYKDGFKYNEIAAANKITDPRVVQVGTVLEIPKLEVAVAAKPAESPAAQPSVSPEPVAAETNLDKGTGGAVNQTQWGEKIEGATYTVAAGDWLSTIAGRAYGDIYAFEKIAKANNLTNPDLIEPGTVLKLPR